MHDHDRAWIAALLDAARMDKHNRTVLRDKYQSWFAVSRHYANIELRKYLIDHNWLTFLKIEETTVNARRNRVKKRRN
jgi:hypothetical protein